MDKLEELASKKRNSILRNSYSKSIVLARYYDEEKLILIETLIQTIQELTERVKILEKQNKNE